jgi:uncharacterized protein (DUF488 family)
MKRRKRVSRKTGLFTIGHSNRALDEFVRMLQAHGVEVLVDVRTIPRSRHNPQFNGDALTNSLRAAKIGYSHMKALGGLRRTRKDSINAGWRNASFRGFADYMQTAEFADALGDLMALSRTKSVAIMCAEALPWRCHRSLIADALTVRGINVQHIFSETQCKSHSLTPFLKTEDGRLSYPEERHSQPAEKQQLLGFNAPAAAAAGGTPGAVRSSARPQKGPRSPTR